MNEFLRLTYFYAMKKNNPKALNIEKIQHSDKRVTLGFKCSPKTKIELAEKAAVNDISLSEYVERLVVNLPIKNMNLRKKVNDLENRLSFYENNSIILDILKREFGKQYDIQTSDDKIIKVKIAEAKDVFTIIVNCFKNK